MGAINNMTTWLRAEAREAAREEAARDGNELANIMRCLEDYDPAANQWPSAYTPNAAASIARIREAAWERVSDGRNESDGPYPVSRRDILSCLESRTYFGR